MRRQLLLVTTLSLISLGGCTKPTSIPPSNDDKPPQVSLLSASSLPARTEPAIAIGAGPTASRQVSIFPANARYKFVARAANPGGVKSLSIVATQAGATIYSRNVAGSQNNDGTVPDSLSIFDNPLEFNGANGTAIVTADATNFNNMSTHFVVTYAVPADPVVTLTTTDVCGSGIGVVLNVAVGNVSTVTSLVATWYREVLTVPKPTLTSPAHIVLHPISETERTSGPEQLFPLDYNAASQGRAQDIHFQISGNDGLSRPLSAKVHTGSAVFSPLLCAKTQPE